MDERVNFRWKWKFYRIMSSHWWRSRFSSKMKLFMAGLFVRWTKPSLYRIMLKPFLSSQMSHTWNCWIKSISFKFFITFHPNSSFDGFSLGLQPNSVSLGLLLDSSPLLITWFILSCSSISSKRFRGWDLGGGLSVIHIPPPSDISDESPSL